ncbi:MAG: riboflavin biosynthesis protein RibF [Oligosphaeraceae bacterium]
MTTPSPPPLSSLQRLQGRIALALGVFDGVHRGHQAVLSTLLREARAREATPVALFFDPPPRQLLFPQDAPRLLTSLPAKVRLLRQAGMEEVVCLPFTRELSRLTPREFWEGWILSNPTLQIPLLCVGEDWRFGAGNQGTLETLRALAREQNIQVTGVPPLLCRGERISSTRVRSAVAQGDLSLARELLGRPFTLEGEIVHGQGKARRSLDCPTANLEGDHLQLPPPGVYAAWTRLEDASTPLPGILYIGEAPTFRGEGNGHPVVELHLFHFQGDLYGKSVSIAPEAFLRESRLFPSPDLLARQIQKDIRQAHLILQRNPPAL